MQRRCILRHVFLIILFICLVAVPAFAVSKAEQQTFKNSVITVPAGELINSVLTTPLNSSALQQGQTISVVVTEDFYYNSKLVIPADSMIYGNVISVDRTAESNSPDKMLLRFTQIITPSGVQIPIAALIQSKDCLGMISGNDEEYKNYKGHIVIDVGTPFSLYLTQPITVNQEAYNSNY